ncbi:hypothetical protein HHI36_002637 [Cryptolaemus montrouzieri]|uniref:lysozyme n=1 Tax=Cryptolaemus montrouzieri TaxID=559131 RepID=A0ABD2PB13_9CUCU
MARRIVIIIYTLAIFFNAFGIYGKVYTRCGLVKELLNMDFSRSFIGNWVCLIESESGKNTSSIKYKANRSQGLGIFQIRSKDWCTFHRKGGICNVRCEDMLDENITDDATCAQKFGFRAWDGWKRNCKGRKLPLPLC